MIDSSNKFKPFRLLKASKLIRIFVYITKFRPLGLISTDQYL